MKKKTYPVTVINNISNDSSHDLISEISQRRSRWLVAVAWDWK